MKVIENEIIVYIDCDDTLVMWEKPNEPDVLKKQFNMYGETVYLYPHPSHIQLLKSYKARGHFVIVHSGNGFAWAKEVVKTLKLEEFVDIVATKPMKIVDNEDIDKWLPRPIYLTFKKEDIDG